ncbi:MAG: BON domain-containing protein [Gemmatales bacterium]
MKRWYLFASVVAVLTVPSMVLGQMTGTGGSSSNNNGGSRGSSSGSGSSSGLAGSANTTLLGNQVNLNFNSVFGTNAQLANTTADNFAAYRPTGSGSGSGSGGSSFSGGSGITNSGLGSGTGGFSGTGTGARTGGTSTGGLSSGGISGSLGTGGTAGGLGGNRGGLGGGLTGGGLNSGGLGGGFGNRGMMGGGTGFLGGNQGGFMGGMNNQQNNTAQGTMGYQVNYGGTGSAQLPVTTNLTPNTDFQQRLQTSPGMQSASGLQVFTTGNTAILRGQVGSDYAKQLAAAMIRLEPGVYDVQNELVVVTPKQ